MRLWQSLNDWYYNKATQKMWRQHLKNFAEMLKLSRLKCRTFWNLRFQNITSCFSTTSSPKEWYWHQNNMLWMQCLHAATR